MAEPDTPRWTRTHAGVAAAAALILTVRAWPTLDSTVDDAFISARYARNLAEGSGLIYNVGEPAVEGISNLAWTVLLAVFLLLGVEARTAMLGLGLLFGLGALWASMGLTRAIAGRAGPGEWVAPLWLALHPALAISTTNGLESSMFACAVLMASWAVLAAPDTRRPLTGLGLGLLGLIRPEGLAVAVAWLLYDLWARRGEREDRFTLWLGWTAVQLPVWLWRRWTYGADLPNTFAAKGGREWFDHWERNLAYIDRYEWLWYAVLALGLAGALSGRGRWLRTLWVAALASGMVLIALQVNLWMPGGRLLVPSTALVACLAGAALSDARGALRLGWGSLLVMTGLYSLSPELTAELRKQDRIYSVSSHSGIEQTARHLASHAAEGSWLAVRDAGVMAYYVGSEVVVGELHPRALTQPHPGGRSARVDDFLPRDPAFVVATVRKWGKGPDKGYPTDAWVWRYVEPDYDYLGRVQMHHHRYYDVFVRADLDVPPLAPSIVIDFSGAKPETAIRRP